ncbi:MAG TPA: 23S rRNA (pseudouridine(1915)-N(3))-methyltransferase RlmH, partial [Methylovirgula sp.]
CHYVTRAEGVGRGLGVKSLDIREIEESKARRPDDRKKEEARALSELLASLRAPNFVVFDERGDTLTSAAFAEKLDRLRESGVQHMAFILGGPDGLDADLCAQAAFRVAFGRMSWPHQLARIMAAEQIYRALTLSAGHPYHRG